MLVEMVYSIRLFVTGNSMSVRVTKLHEQHFILQQVHVHVCVYLYMCAIHVPLMCIMDHMVVHTFNCISFLSSSTCCLRAVSSFLD